MSKHIPQDAQSSFHLTPTPRYNFPNTVRQPARTAVSLSPGPRILQLRHENILRPDRHQLIHDLGHPRRLDHGIDRHPPLLLQARQRRRPLPGGDAARGLQVGPAADVVRDENVALGGDDAADAGGDEVDEGMLRRGGLGPLRGDEDGGGGEDGGDGFQARGLHRVARFCSAVSTGWLAGESSAAAAVKKGGESGCELTDEIHGGITGQTQSDLDTATRGPDRRLSHFPMLLPAIRISVHDNPASLPSQPLEELPRQVRETRDYALPHAVLHPFQLPPLRHLHLQLALAKPKVQHGHAAAGLGRGHGSLMLGDLVVACYAEVDAALADDGGDVGRGEEDERDGQAGDVGDVAAVVAAEVQGGAVQQIEDGVVEAAFLGDGEEELILEAGGRPRVGVSVCRAMLGWGGLLVRDSYDLPRSIGGALRKRAFRMIRCLVQRSKSEIATSGPLVGKWEGTF